MENVESAKSQWPHDINVIYITELIANIRLMTVLQCIQLFHYKGTFLLYVACENGIASVFTLPLATYLTILQPHL